MRFDCVKLKQWKIKGFINPGKNIHRAIKHVSKDWRYHRVTKNCKSQNRQYNYQNKKDKRTNNGLQNITQKTKDRATRNPQKPREWSQELRNGKHIMLHRWHPSSFLVTNPVMSHEWVNDRIVITTNVNYDRYSVTVNQVMAATVKLSKRCVRFNHYEPLVH
jgi:hypothetical protein